MDHRTFFIRWFLYLSIIGCFFVTQPSFARIIFSTEFIAEQHENTFVIDSEDDVAGNISLQFGNTLGKTITYDVGNSWFGINANININGYQLINTRLENSPTDPGPCIISRAGRTYYNTTTKRLRYCDSSVWVEISNSGGGGGGTPGPQGPAGEDGLAILMAQSPADIELCPQGGYVFSTGLDTNRNNVLDSGEVNSTATICNGVSISNTLAGTCNITLTASYSGSAQYSVSLSGMVSYAGNLLQIDWANDNYISSISNSNGGNSSWLRPVYLLAIGGTGQNFMLYLNYTGTPPPGQVPSITAAQIKKNGQILHCNLY